MVEGVRAEAEALRGDLDAERRERAAVERRNADLTDRIQELERQLARANLDKEQAQANPRAPGNFSSHRRGDWTARKVLQRTS